MKSPRIRHIIWLLLLWLMPGSFVVMGQNVNGESAQEAENVQDTIAPRYSVRKTCLLYTSANATVGVPGQTGMATVVNHDRWCIVQFHIGIIHLFYDTFYLGR